MRPSVSLTALRQRARQLVLQQHQGLPQPIDLHRFQMLSDGKKLGAFSNPEAVSMLQEIDCSKFDPAACVDVVVSSVTWLPTSGWNEGGVALRTARDRLSEPGAYEALSVRMRGHLIAGLFKMKRQKDPQFERRFLRFMVSKAEEHPIRINLSVLKYIVTTVPQDVNEPLRVRHLLGTLRRDMKSLGLWNITSVLQSFQRLAESVEEGISDAATLSNVFPDIIDFAEIALGECGSVIEKLKSHNGRVGTTNGHQSVANVLRFFLRMALMGNTQPAVDAITSEVLEVAQQLFSQLKAILDVSTLQTQSQGLLMEVEQLFGKTEGKGSAASSSTPSGDSTGRVLSVLTSTDIAKMDFTSFRTLLMNTKRTAVASGRSSVSAELGEAIVARLKHFVARYAEAEKTTAMSARTDARDAVSLLHMAAAVASVSPSLRAAYGEVLAGYVGMIGPAGATPEAACLLLESTAAAFGSKRIRSADAGSDELAAQSVSGELGATLDAVLNVVLTTPRSSIPVFSRIVAALEELDVSAAEAQPIVSRCHNPVYFIHMAVDARVLEAVASLAASPLVDTAALEALRCKVVHMGIDGKFATSMSGGTKPRQTVAPVELDVALNAIPAPINEGLMPAYRFATGSSQASS